MTKTIDTLAEDIESLFVNSSLGLDSAPDEEALAKLGVASAMAVQRALQGRNRLGRKPLTIYASEYGQPCSRRLWYSVRTPDAAETMQGHTLFKFLYGDLLEETVLSLAEAAGHCVTKRQLPVEHAIKNGWVIRGRIDAVIDGVLVDVKSVSPYGFKEFESGLTEENDDFGYRWQLAAYATILGYSRMGFLVVDKQNGRIRFFEQEPLPCHMVINRMFDAVGVVSSDAAPTRQPRFDLVPDGKSGNEKLCTACSYCPFKQTCWADANEGAGLRAFAYSTGPVFLGTVAKTPKVPEIRLPATRLYTPSAIPSRTPTTTTITGVAPSATGSLEVPEENTTA